MTLVRVSKVKLLRRFTTLAMFHNTRKNMRYKIKTIVKTLRYHKIVEHVQNLQFLTRVLLSKGGYETIKKGPFRVT